MKLASEGTGQDHQRRELLIAWIGILLAPLTWIVSFEANYALAPYACQSRSPLVLHAVSTIALAVSGLGLMAAWHTWRANGKVALTDEADTVHRNGFLGMFGLLFSGILMILIAAQWVPVFLVDPCNP